MSEVFIQFIEIGKQLGLEGEKLIEFASKKEQERMDRDERARAREMEREERERQRLHEERLEELRARNDTNGNNANAGYVYRPKLPKFDDEKDDLDAYIERFERFAISQGWQGETWAQNLSFLLSGKALEVYSSLPETKVKDYDFLKKQLLTRFQLSAECFRHKFRNSRPEKNEMMSQFMNRITRYLDRWVELSDANDEVKDLKDLLLREQFLNGCSNELAIFIRERAPRSVTEMM
jgi:hypothetical protein